MAGWLSDVFFVGALGSGVNFATLMVINLVTGMAFLSLLFLLVTVQGDPELWPHVVVLLVFAAGASLQFPMRIRAMHNCMMHTLRAAIECLSVIVINELAAV